MDRLLRAISVAIIFFAVVIAFIVGSRIDQNTVAMMGGTVIGILVTAPAAAIVTFVLLRRRNGPNQQQPIPYQQPAPMYYMPPQAPQYYLPQQQPLYPQASFQYEQLPVPRRQFMVIGDDEPEDTDGI